MLSWSRAFECIISCFVMVFFSLQSELHLNPPTLTPQTRRWPGSDVTPPPAKTSAMDFFLSKTWSKRMFYLKSVPKAVSSTIDKGKSSHVRFFWKSRVPYWTTDFVSMHSKIRFLLFKIQARPVHSHRRCNDSTGQEKNVWGYKSKAST